MDQSSSDMPPLQSEPWETVLTPRAGFVPRLGQRRLWTFAMSTEETAGLVEHPTGYGKTEEAVGLYAIFRARKRVGHCLYLCSTDVQRATLGPRRRIDDDGRIIFDDPGAIARAAVNLGVQLIGQRAHILTGTVRDYRMVAKQRAEIFIGSYQHCVASRHGIFDFYREILRTGDNWLVIYDEAQRLAERDESGWGSASEFDLEGLIRVYLSANPIRSDGRSLHKVPRDPETGEFHRWDVITAKEAITEQAIRIPAADIEHYFIDVTEGDQPTTRRLRTADLRGEDIDDYEVRKQIRYEPHYISSILLSAWQRLTTKLLRHPGQHQMVIRGMSTNHIRVVTAQMNAIEPGCADWIGIYRSDDENQAILDRFLANELLVIGHINKLAEAFNNPRASVLVLVDLIEAESNLMQMLGRGLRRNAAIPWEEDICDVFFDASNETLRRLIESLTPTDPEEMDRRGPRHGRDWPPPLPDIEVIRTEHERTERWAPHGDVVEARVRAEAIRLGIPPEKAQALWEALRGPSREGKPTEPGESVYWPARVNLLLSSVTGLVIRVVASDGLTDPGFAGRVKMALNIRWVRQSRVKHDAMLPEEFQAKAKWLTEIYNGIVRSHEVPEWLRHA
jgi:superfamily II DNA or RNA helicase